MLDVLMWPFVERAKALPILYNEPMNFEKEKYPRIVSYDLRDYTIKNLNLKELNHISEKFSDEVDLLYEKSMFRERKRQFTRGICKSCRSFQCRNH